VTIEAPPPPAAIVQPLENLAAVHKIKLDLILEHVRFHAASLDHHWAELAAAGLDLNRLMAAAGTATPEQIRELRVSMGQYIRNCAGSANLALDAQSAKKSLTQTKQEARKEHERHT
jgi:hypothetical protein